MRSDTFGRGSSTQRRARAGLALLAALAAGTTLAFAPHIAHAQADCDGWVALHDLLPRRSANLVPTPDGIVLFGGQFATNDGGNTSTVTSETWTFKDNRWRFVTMNGPSPRAGAAAVFDSVANRVVLFGGATSTATAENVPSNETWAFASNVWTRLTPATSPGARSGHAMAFDAARNEILMYGGSGTSASTEFWRFDGTTWTQLPSTTQPNPGSQFNPRMVFNSADNLVYLFVNNPAPRAWIWNGASWTQGPSMPFHPISVTFNQSTSSMLLVSPTGQFAEYVGGTQPPVAWTTPNSAPPVSSGFSLAPLPNRSFLVTLASAANPNVANAASYRVNTTSGWQPIASTKPHPSASVDMALAFHPPGQHTVFFGGAQREGLTPLNQTWTLRGERWKRFETNQPVPGSRVRSQMAFVPTRGVTALVGGTPGDSSAWAWTGDGWTFSAGLGITGELGTPAVFDPSRQALATTRFGTVTFSQGFAPGQAFSAPGADGSNGAMAYDPIRGRLIFAAGQGASSTYALGPGQTPLTLLWSSVVANRQTGSWGARMAFDPGRRGLVLFGGFASPSGATAFPRSTYFLGSEATAWSTLPLNSPTGRKSQGMVWDPLSERIIMTGGVTHQSTVPLVETWKLARGPAAIAVDPNDTFLIPGQTGELFTIAKGGGVLAYQWFRDGQPVPPSDRVRGTDTDTLTFDPFEPDDAGIYTVRVSNPCGQATSRQIVLGVRPICIADFDGSGEVDPDDFLAFLAAHEKGLMSADADLDGGITGADLKAYLEQFELGCGGK
jgi:hypothetical protein